MRQHQDELDQLQTQVLVISFDNGYGALAWQQETDTSFLLLLDRERRVYRYYGLERSFFRSWNLRTIWLYARLLLSGRKWRGVQGDSAQLGGDFIVDGNGIVRLAYRSHDPADRPSVVKLLAALRQLKGEGVEHDGSNSH